MSRLVPEHSAPTTVLVCVPTARTGVRASGGTTTSSRPSTVPSVGGWGVLQSYQPLVVGVYIPLAAFTFTFTFTARSSPLGLWLYCCREQGASVFDVGGVWAHMSCPPLFSCGRGGECLRSKQPPRIKRLHALVQTLLHNVSLYLADETVSSLLSAPPPFGFEDNCTTIAKDRKCYSQVLCHNGFVDRVRLATFLRTAKGPVERTFNSCAVVGNSGTLQQHAHGTEIDAHDAVIRVQTAPVGGMHAAYAGRRTTLWVRSASLHAHPSDDGKPVVVVCNQPRVDACHDRLWAHRSARSRVHALSPLFLYAVRNITGGLIPLTGVVATMLALKSCASVSAYGFYGGVTSSACRYYYDCNSTDGDYNNHYYFGFHRTDGNLNLLRELNASGLLRWRDKLFGLPKTPAARRLQQQHAPVRHTSASRATAPARAVWSRANLTAALLSKGLSNRGGSFLRVADASRALSAAPLSLVLVTFHTRGPTAKLCQAFAKRAVALSPHLDRALLPIELLPPSNTLKTLSFIEALALKLRAIVLLLRALRSSSLPAVVVDCDVVLFRAQAVHQLVSLCTQHDLCFMLDAAGASFRGGSAATLDSNSASHVNGGLLVIPDSSSDSVLHMLESASDNLTKTIQDRGPAAAAALLPLGDQTIYQMLLRTPSELRQAPRWAIYSQQQVSSGLGGEREISSGMMVVGSCCP